MRGRLAWHPGTDAACAACNRCCTASCSRAMSMTCPSLGWTSWPGATRCELFRVLSRTRCMWQRKYDVWLCPLLSLVLAMQVTLGIVDVSPASLDRSLPSIVAQTVQCAPALWSKRACDSPAAGAHHCVLAAVDADGVRPGGASTARGRLHPLRGMHPCQTRGCKGGQGSRGARRDSWRAAGSCSGSTAWRTTAWCRSGAARCSRTCAS